VRAKEIAIRGVITRIEWTNPHALLWVDATVHDGMFSADGSGLPGDRWSGPVRQATGLV